MLIYNVLQIYQTTNIALPCFFKLSFVTIKEKTYKAPIFAYYLTITAQLLLLPNTLITAILTTKAEQNLNYFNAAFFALT
jgi:hypothetical protein